MVAKSAVSSFTKPVIVPGAVSASPSYTLLASGVSTVSGALVISIVPVICVILRSFVTSMPWAFTITRLSAVAVTFPSLTCVAVAVDFAVFTV